MHPPTELNVGNPLSKYFHRYKDYLELRVYLKNDSATINDPDELDTFILLSNQCFEFRIWYHEESQYKDKKKR